MPSYAELAGLFGFASKNAAKYRVDKWVEAGVLIKDSVGKILPGESFHPLRVLGSVETGPPSATEEEQANTASLDEWLIGKKEVSLMLHAADNSMIQAGICPGDRIILARQRTPKSGDIVMVEIEQRWTLRYYEQQKTQIILKPANARFKSIRSSKELKIAGVVTAVIRKY
ncbi:hypothetical protein KKF05_02335 [Patescibacteria group bacterium]|nr:hypothetical protein [Patescibacteria group bacterium]